MRLNVLQITPDFNYACGRSYYVNLLAKYLSAKHNVSVITNGGDSLERLEEKNIAYKLLRSLKSKNPLTLNRNIKYLKKYIEENKIDIIHTHHRLAELLAVQAAGKLRKNKPVTVFTSLSLVNRKYNIEYRSDQIIAVSGSIQNMLQNKFKINKDKIHLINNFTDTDEIHELEIIAPRARNHGKHFIVLAIGRFHNDKDFETLLKALNILKKENIGLILVGEGNNDIDYRRFIAKNNLNVEIIVPQKNLLQYFLIADICVLPSTRDPFPNFMLQAGLHRVPFIGANVDGIGELIKDGENGLLFEAGDDITLAKKIMVFKHHHSLAEKCAVRLHGDVINNYTQEFIIPKIESLYRSAVRH
jgi:glycosyltransferase involved in cell wall biosynthesis